MATVPVVLVLHVLLGAAAAACAVAVDAAAAAAGSSKVPAIYVFGDSTADVGNNNYLPGGGVPRANFPHNGVDFPTSRPTGRFSNGYNGVDFLGKALNSQLQPAPRSFTHLWLRVLCDRPVLRRIV
jgi:hypothetical protein